MMLAFDTETAPIAPGLLAPPLACVTWARPGLPPKIAHWSDALPVVREWLRGDDLIVGHNVAYDMAVLGAQFPELLPLIFASYDADRVTDTMIRQKLLDIARGCYRGGVVDGVWRRFEYTLQALTHRYTGRMLEKDEFRLRYGEFRDLPLDQWPEGARAYAMLDAESTLVVHQGQESHAALFPSQFHEARAAFALHLESCWGLRTSPEGVRQFAASVAAERERLQARLVEAGLVRPDGSRDTKAASKRILDVFPSGPKTPTGAPSLDQVACERSGDEVLQDYSRYSVYGKAESADVPLLEAGITTPIQTRYDLAETGRTTSSKPNIQNLRTLPGVRECFVPRSGRVFVDADYSALELWTLAFVQEHLFGSSRLGEVLLSGRDPHTALAADLVGCSYEEGVRRKKARCPTTCGACDVCAFAVARSTAGAKGANFGYPGGMGISKFTVNALRNGILMTEERARFLRDTWMRTWPEMRQYFAHVSEQTSSGAGTVIVPVTGHVRGGASYCQFANTYFQSLGAAVTKRAAWFLAKECYVGSGILRGARVVAVIHDQFLTEIDDDDRVHESAFEVVRCMQDAAREILGKYVPGVEPVLSDRWSKLSEQVWGEDGRLRVWRG